MHGIVAIDHVALLVDLHPAHAFVAVGFYENMRFFVVGVKLKPHDAASFCRAQLGEDIVFVQYNTVGIGRGDLFVAVKTRGPVFVADAQLTRLWRYGDAAVILCAGA